MHAVDVLNAACGELRCHAFDRRVGVCSIPAAHQKLVSGSEIVLSSLLSSSGKSPKKQNLAVTQRQRQIQVFPSGKCRPIQHRGAAW